MKQFMDKDFLLYNDTAKKLFHECAADMPIFDWHCHLSPKEIYETVWKEKLKGTDNTVAVHIRHLREKIEIDSSNPRYIKVVWGQGYVLEAPRA